MESVNKAEHETMRFMLAAGLSATVTGLLFHRYEFTIWGACVLFMFLGRIAMMFFE